MNNKLLHPECYLDTATKATSGMREYFERDPAAMAFYYHDVRELARQVQALEFAMMGWRHVYGYTGWKK